jgi:hypothetical protein
MGPRLWGELDPFWLDAAPFTLEMIQQINANGRIPADLLVQPYRVAATAA